MGLVKGMLQGEIVKTETAEDFLLVTVHIPKQYLHAGLNPCDLQNSWVGIIPEETVNQMEKETISDA